MWCLELESLHARIIEKLQDDDTADENQKTLKKRKKNQIYSSETNNGVHFLKTKLPYLCVHLMKEIVGYVHTDSDIRFVCA